jgi:hypothetical protein
MGWEMMIRYISGINSQPSGSYINVSGGKVDSNFQIKVVYWHRGMILERGQ